MFYFNEKPGERLYFMDLNFSSHLAWDLKQGFPNFFSKGPFKEIKKSYGPL